MCSAESTALAAERFEVMPLLPQSGSEQIDAAVRVLALARVPSSLRAAVRAAPARNCTVWLKRWIAPW